MAFGFSNSRNDSRSNAQMFGSRNQNRNQSLNWNANQNKNMNQNQQQEIATPMQQIRQMVQQRQQQIQNQHMARQQMPVQNGSMNGQGGAQRPQNPQMQARPQNPPIGSQLPDGVTYQPLDERTMAEVRRFLPDYGTDGGGKEAPRGELPQIMPLSRNAAPGVPGMPMLPPVLAEPPLPPVLAEPPSISTHSAEGLRQLIQNEDNGARYYQNLAQAADNSRYTQLIHEIGEGCKNRNELYSGLYRKYHSEDYVSLQPELSGIRSFRDGVIVAIEEENRALRELSRFYESASDGELSRAINARIYEKVSDISSLHLMLNRFSNFEN